MKSSNWKIQALWNRRAGIQYKRDKFSQGPHTRRTNKLFFDYTPQALLSMPGTVEDLTYIHLLNLPTNFMSRVIFSSPFCTCGNFQVETQRGKFCIQGHPVHGRVAIWTTWYSPFKDHTPNYYLFVGSNTYLIGCFCLKFWFPVRQMLLKIVFPKPFSFKKESCYLLMWIL